MFLSLSLGLVFTIFSFLTIPNIAHADYTWVTGSYQNKDMAIARVNDNGFMAINAKIVTTKADGFRFRVIAGQYANMQDAYADRDRVLKSGAKGVWLMTIKPMVFASPILYKDQISRHGGDAAAVRQPKESPQPTGVNADGQKERHPAFTPKKWSFNGGLKVAFTAGENPSIYFNNDNYDCRMLVKHYVFDMSEVAPPRRYEDYFKERIGNEKHCHVAHVYKVISK